MRPETKKEREEREFQEYLVEQKKRREASRKQEAEKQERKRWEQRQFKSRQEAARRRYDNMMRRRERDDKIVQRYFNLLEFMKEVDFPELSLTEKTPLLSHSLLSGRGSVNSNASILEPITLAFNLDEIMNHCISLTEKNDDGSIKYLDPIRNRFFAEVESASEADFNNICERDWYAICRTIQAVPIIGMSTSCFGRFEKLTEVVYGERIRNEMRYYNESKSNDRPPSLLCCFNRRNKIKPLTDYEYVRRCIPESGCRKLYIQFFLDKSFCVLLAKRIRQAIANQEISLIEVNDKPSTCSSYNIL